MAPRYTPAERAILYACTFGRLPLETVNQVLGSVSSRQLPASSYQMLTSGYAKFFADDPARLGNAIFKPVSMKEIAAAAKASNDFESEVGDFESDENAAAVAHGGLLDGDRFLTLLKEALPTDWSGHDTVPGASGWTQFMTDRLTLVARNAGLGICSHYLEDAPRTWKNEGATRQLRREYGFDFTLFRDWTEYEQPAVLIEHENAWNLRAFLADFWKLMFGYAPLRVMFGYHASESGISAYVERIRELARANSWTYPSGTEDIVLLGHNGMEPHAFRVLRRYANSGEWRESGVLSGL
ncbi:hypothetical protein [Vulgatibacter sp.]|uniref:hypothetical protein n=1 Tax=Vulgatibacter sp. TaxID=1971226 RepID=UPI0035682994